MSDQMDEKRMATAYGAITLVLWAIRKHGLEKTLQDLRQACDWRGVYRRGNDDEFIQKSYEGLIEIIKEGQRRIDNNIQDPSLERLKKMTEDIINRLMKQLGVDNEEN